MDEIDVVGLFNHYEELWGKMPTGGFKRADMLPVTTEWVSKRCPSIRKAVADFAAA